MQPAKKNIRLHLTNVSNEGRVRTLYPDTELYMPIKQLVLPQNFSIKLNDILKICELIEAGMITEPIIVNGDNLIVDGKKRYFAFKRLGVERLNVLRVNSVQSNDKENDFTIIKSESY